ncbi:unnamed protein product [Gongylonema pulchrum]|uniref:Chitin-binding type-2 domain-containing protein n=1 Tax=Gongylonema pulchrum TaxID=637853 RepID=A0A183DS32_9BILA|nr:unnamed protein product [Gongylonema pulchrum]
MITHHKPRTSAPIVDSDLSSTTQQANGSDIDTKEAVEPSAESQDERVNEVKIAERSRASHIPEAALPAAIGVPLPKAKDQPILPDDFDCASKPNGLYSIGCKTEYVTCVLGHPFYFHCPSNLIFYEAAQTCDHAENIAECSNVSLGTRDAHEYIYKFLCSFAAVFQGYRFRTIH